MRLNKFLTMLAAVAVFGLIAASCGGNYSKVKDDPTQTRIYTLDNGLTVYLSVIKKEPRIQTYVAFRVGSKNDPSETTGLSHYLEHLMFKGSEQFGTSNYEAEKPYLDQIEAEFEKYRTLTDPEERKAQYAVIDSLSYAASEYFIGNEYDKIMAAMGAKGSNAFTSFDMTVYTEDIPSNQVEAWAKVQSDRFQHLVMRGFHTELEAVYEECNLGLSDDGGNAIDTLFFALFDKHPYGEQTTIGTQEHLKNPSLTNIRKHFENFYVPNNAAICMAGDFNPDEVIKIIKKYFGGWKANPEIKNLEFEDEAPIAEHIEKTTYGLESPFVMLGWRFNAPYRAGKEELSNTTDTLYLVSQILYNGKAGLFDKELNRPQKVLSAGAFNYGLADYSVFLIEVEPREGQTLDEAKALAMEQLERVKTGDFNENILSSILNNYKRQKMLSLDSYRSRASYLYNAFIKHLPWDYMVNEGDRLSKITKEDIVAFAQRNFNDNYVQVNKVQAPQQGVQKIEKPAITSIRTNRDSSSAFLRDMETFIEKAKPIEPVFVDFDKELAIADYNETQKFYYKHNDDNELFYINYYFENGSNDNKVLPYAMSYIRALGTDSLSADEINDKFYDLACSFNTSVGSNNVNLGVSGLGSSMDEALALFENWINNVKPDDNLLLMMKQNWIREMYNKKVDKSSNETGVNYYAIYGPENPFNWDLKPLEILALTSEQLLGEVKNLLNHTHSVIYYGPLSQEESKAKIAEVHKLGEGVEYGPSKVFKAASTANPTIFIAPYKANEIHMYKISTYDTAPYDYKNDALVRLYDAYFGSGMSSIVFQDIREAKGLAYHASANTSLPGRVGQVPYYTARIYTQNDKMLDAMKAFDEILTDMPENDRSFDVTKKNLVQNYATMRYTDDDVIWHYLDLKEKGVDLTYDKDFYETLKTLTLADIVKYQQENIKGRPFVTGICGNPAELDLKGIDPSYGPVKILKTEDVFGY